MAGVISVRLPDGSEREIAEGTTAAEFAETIGPRLAKAALAATVDGHEVDLSTALVDGAEVAIVTADSDVGREVLRHSTAHVMAQAVLRLWPGAKYAIGPVIENGFYYDFALPDGAHFSEDDLGRIETEMRAIMAENQPFIRHEHAVSEGLELFVDQPFKQEIIEAVGSGADEVDAGGTVVSTYSNSDTFMDLCRGPHVPSTSRLGHFKLMRVAGAYWRGDEKRAQLQRIYGTAWESEKALNAYLHQLEEAERRDHRKLGAELDLFSFPEEIGSGLALFHPKGGTIRRIMEDYSRQRHVEEGYEFVNSPHITKSELFEISGHLDWFAEGMYPPMELDGGTQYYLKPMNCPFHILVYRSRQRSYRDLPLRFFEFGSVYRYEKSGVVHGLTRVRGMTQDDAHIFCTRRGNGTRVGPYVPLRARSPARLRPQRLLSRALHQASGQGGRIGSRTGRRPQRPCAPPRPRSASTLSWTRAVGPSTVQRSQCRRRTPSVAPGRCRPCNSTSSSPNALSSSTSGPTTGGTDRS